ncbi:MAG: UvrD/REP helicase, helicase / ATP-dependent helicase PcrA, partial [Candidatus Krumholzibacteriota bacterium]|nr:UvrD/REP helicase, helicase / ATP-dependent helicase PcrA [Candidatus Krumholzibacteriota bacterium]
MRVLGPPGSGKTRLLVERFRALEARLREPPAPRDDGAARAGAGGVYILTYSAESHRRLTGAVFGKNTARLGPSPVLTYTRLAQEIIESSTGRSPFIVDDLEERLLLDDVIARHEARMKSELRSICRSERFLEDVLEACHILLQNGVEDRLLGGMESYAAKSAELHDVLSLYREYRRALASMGGVTYYDVSWAALGCLRRGFVDHPLTRAAAILVEDFQDIDAGQFELLKSIAPPGGTVALNVFGDPLGSVFANRGTQHAYLTEEFARLYGGETYYVTARARRGGAPEATIEALLNEVLGEGKSAYLPVAPDGGGGLRLELTRDEVDECWTVAAKIASVLRNGERRAEDIAVITNNKRLYEPILAAAATQRGIPLDTGRARKGTFGDFADAFLALVDFNDDEIASRAVLTSPLFPWLRDIFPGAPDDARAASRDRKRLRSFVDELQKRLLAAPAARRMRIIADDILYRLSDAFAKETGDDSAYHETSALLEEWERYSSAVGKWGGTPSIGAFAGMENRLAKRRVAQGAGRVSLLTPREAKGCYFPIVFVMGCSELLFPSAARSESILPLAALEQALRSVFPGRPVSLYRMRSAAKQLSDEHHKLYIALTRSIGSVLVTAPKVFSGDDYPAPSAILDRTFPAEVRVETPSEEKTAPQIRFAKTWTSGGPVLDSGGALDRLSPAGAQWHPIKPEAVLVQLERFPLSQSSIGTFLGCERRFFYEKVLRIPQADTPAARVGAVLHDVMADLGGRFPSKTDLIGSCTPEVVRGAIDDAVERDETIGKGSFFDRALRHHLAVMVDGILHLERSDPASFTIVEREHNLKFSRGPWAFTGRIDRIDETGEGERAIVDYKTGKLDKMGQTLRKKTLLALEKPEDANWQVPLYAWGMKAAEGSSPRAFTHLVTRAGDKPFRVTLFIRRRMEDVPAEAVKGRGTSYLLESEIEEIMDRAVKFAEEIFTPRARFEKTGDASNCQ